MEDGSLLPVALAYMKKLRQREYNINFPYDHFQSQSNSSTPNDSSSRLGEGNALIISLFCIDSHGDVEVGHELNRKNLLRKLAKIHSTIHSNIIPAYNKKYAHSWFLGGSGLSFGLHCKEEEGDDAKERGGIPHLRAVVHYGPNPLDELFAVAMMVCLSSDLLQYYNYKVGIECWDVDDGQILLIEGANYLPSWVDDEVGVDAMSKRVYIVNGQIHLLSSCYKGEKSSNVSSSKYILTRRESLKALIDNVCQDQDLDSIALTRAILKRLESFCKVLTQPLDVIQKRHLLQDHLHTAAVVVPMQLAIVLKYRPDLIPVAILTFCRRISEGVNNKVQHGLVDDDATKISFENLVFTKISISKTLYAMLITAAGQMPPPMKTPSHYNTMELHRIKRQCQNGGMGYAHFRHAIEAGMRLALGFEWLAVQSLGNHTSKISTTGRPLLCCSAEERLLQHTVRIDMEAGGDGEWIRSSWNVGPNHSNMEDDIGTLLKCPVWEPEIMQGGLCPISNPGKSVAQHVSDACKFARKKNYSSNDVLKMFPIPRDCDVDSDDWIDLNSIDDLEKKLLDITKISHLKVNSTKESDETQMRAMETLATHMETFIEGSSDVKGVSSGMKEATDFVNSEVYLKILHRVLKENPSSLRFDDITVTPKKGTETNESSELLKYFSEEDLNWDIYESGYGVDEEMVALMKEMDEQLSATDPDRKLKVFDAHNDRGNDNEDLGLPFDDPAAIKANVISNLLESLDAQDGNSGPVTTIFSEGSKSDNMD